MESSEGNSNSPGLLQETEALNTLRQDVERALQHLLAPGSKPAVLIAREWHVGGVPFAFEHMALFQELATNSNCFIVPIDQAEEGGIDHLLFAARSQGLKEQEYLACIDEWAVPTASLVVPANSKS